MPAQPVTLNFPSAGMDLTNAFSRQRPKQIQGSSRGIQQNPVTNQPIIGGYDLSQAQPDPNMWAKTTILGTNVRGFDPQQNRRRGGSRAGLSRFINTQPSGFNIVQNITYIAGNSTVQTSSSGYVSTLVAVVQGNVFFANSGDTTWTQATNNTSPVKNPPLAATGVVQSTVLNQCVFFFDGQGNWVVFSPQGATLGNNVVTIAAGAIGTLIPGTTDLLGNPITSVLPVDNSGNSPKLACTWRTRLVVAGLLKSPQVVQMSALGDPTNWDTDPTFVNSGQAVSFVEASPNGQVGDLVTALIPYTDDLLVIGGQSSIFILNGDPGQNGQLSLISQGIGMAWSSAWCKDPYGNIYFVSNKTGIYVFNPAGGGQPQRISQQIEQLLVNTDMGANTITLVWNDRYQGVHLFITPTFGPTSLAVQSDNVPAQPVTHFFYEQRTGAWWQDRYSNPNLNPLCATEFIGNTPNDRTPIIGSWDGFVRKIDPFATTDDGAPIDSQVLLGPILSPDTDAMRLDEIQGVLGETSGPVDYAILTGRTPEAALISTPVMTGTFQPSRNPTYYERIQGHAIYIELSSSNAWAMEQVRTKIAGTGKVRQRSAY